MASGFSGENAGKTRGGKNAMQVQAGHGIGADEDGNLSQRLPSAGEAGLVFRDAKERADCRTSPDAPRAVYGTVHAYLLQNGRGISIAGFGPGGECDGLRLLVGLPYNERS
jgi:hypothetical protein